MIKRIHNTFFNKDGFVLDDAYDPFKKAQYVNYFKNHQTEYVCCQDADLANLHGFGEIRYLTIPQEAENYRELANISGLTGLELCRSQLSMIPTSVKNNLRYAIVHFANEEMDCAGLTELLELKLDGFPGFRNTDCRFLRGYCLKKLSMCSRYLKSLNGIEFLSELDDLELYSCSNLADISQIASLNSLKRLVLFANNKIDLSFLNHLPLSVESLSIMGTENSARESRFYSLDFLRRLKSLKEFFTNWNVDPELLEQENYGPAKIVIYRQETHRA